MASFASQRQQGSGAGTGTVPQPQLQPQQQQVVMAPPAQSVASKLKMGALMGTGVGLTIGFIGGSLQILRAGPGPRGAMATLSQFMLTSAATFGFFMSIGTVIRTDSHWEKEAEWRASSQRSVMRIPSSLRQRLAAAEQERDARGARIWN